MNVLEKWANQIKTSRELYERKPQALREKYPLLEFAIVELATQLQQTQAELEDYKAGIEGMKESIQELRAQRDALDQSDVEG